MRQWVEAFKAQGFAELTELGLPYAVQCAAKATIGAAFSSNPLGLFALTQHAADLLEAHGSEALRETYLAKLRSAEWMGTMALSEPHAGSSLAPIRTMATPVATEEGVAAGEHRIHGDKMWTTGAFHDLAGNIVHMLLARTPDAPTGAGGISLFLVPNVLPDGRRNEVELVSLNKKMGHKSLTNCAWSLGGDGGGAVGYLVGKRHQGLRGMLMMMNGPARESRTRNLLVPRSGD